jgi:hypothetical protein
MIDNKGRLFGKISVVDIIILLAFVVAIAGFVYKFTSGDKTVTIVSDTPFEVTVMVKNVRQYTVDGAQVGDVVIEQHGSKIGTISKVETKPAMDLAEYPDGSAKYVEVEGRYDLYITIDATGRIDDKGFSVGGNRLVSKGGSLNIETKRLTCQSTIYNVAES